MAVADDVLTVDYDRPSLQQEQMWFLERLAPQGSAYHVGFALELSGPLDLDATNSAISQILYAQDGLRTALGTTEGGRARLIKRPWEPVTLGPHDVPSEPEARAVLQDYLDRPFDLGSGPLYRFVLLRLEPDLHILGCMFHHAVFDGASVGLFIEAWARAYNAVCSGEPESLPSPLVPFSEFVKAQRAAAEGPERAASVAFWKEALEGAEAVELPPDRPRPPSANGSGAHYSHRLSLDLPDAVLTRARAEAATPFMVLIAAFSAFIGRHAGVCDVPVGTPISLRMNRALRSRIAMLVNTVVIRSRFQPSTTFLELLKDVKSSCVSAFKHHAVPFPQVVQAVAPDRTVGKNPIFSAMFILQTAPAVPAVPGLRIRHRELAPTSSKFNLTAALAMTPGWWDFSIEYDTNLFDEKTIARLCRRFEAFLEACVRRPATRVGELPLLTRGDLDDLGGWQVGTPANHSELPPLTELFAEAVRRDPTRIVAIDAAGISWAAGELQDLVGRYRTAFATLNVGEGDRVGIALHPGPELVATALALPHLGAAYVPIDPTVPATRRKIILEDCAPKCILVAAGGSGLAEGSVAAQVVDTRTLYELGGAAASDKTAPSVGAPQPSSIAYVIYTSGSTGRPKGVQITHAALSRFLAAFHAGVELPENARWAALAAFSFDISVLELFYPLIYGGTMVVVPRIVADDAASLAHWLEGGRIDILQATPTRHRMLVAAGWQGHSNLVVLSGGEALTAELARSLLDRASRLINVYGPTEATVWSTTYEVGSADLEEHRPQDQLPIGRPLPGVRAYVLDESGERCPVGVPGELYLAGQQVGLGYLGLTKRTERAFRAQPRVKEERGYATGDRARWRSDGELEFLGREDEQVKIRGHRIELGEVQAHLLLQEGVQEAAVVAQPGPAGATALYGYVVLRPGTHLSGTDLRRQLLAIVPEPFVPSTITVVDSIPKTSSGKLDKKNLPNPRRDLRSLSGLAPPQSSLEETLARVWAETLQVESVGREEDFFDMGGQSIVAVELAAKLSREFERSIPVVDILRFRTIASLADRIRQGAPKLELGGELPRAVVELKSGGPGPVVFFIHDGFGDTVPYLKVAQRMPQEARVYGLEPDRRGGLPTVHTRIEEMGRFFAEQIRVVQPEGPYIVGGLCAGGLLAFEVARQLEQTAQPVGFVGILEAVAPEATPVFAYENRKRAHRLASLLSSLQEEPVEVMVELVKKVFRGASWEARVLAYKTGRRVRYSAARFFETRRELFLKGMDFFSVYDLAAKMYEPEPLNADIPVTLVRATRSVVDDERSRHAEGQSVWYGGDAPRKDLVLEQQDLGWTKYLPRGLKIVDVAAGHSSMLQEDVPAQKIADLFADAWRLAKQSKTKRPSAQGPA